MGWLYFICFLPAWAKKEFGEINWALAVLLTAFGILSFGIGQIAVRRIASGSNAARLLSIYLVHVLIAGSLFYVLLFLSSFIFPSFAGQHNLLLFLGIAKLMIFFLPHLNNWQRV